MERIVEEFVTVPFKQFEMLGVSVHRWFSIQNSLKNLRAFYLKRSPSKLNPTQKQSG
jgi:hypothetical protein